MSTSVTRENSTMKVRFSASMDTWDTNWIVDYLGAIRIVYPNTHSYLISVFCSSDEGEITLPVSGKDVFIDRYGQINISSWNK